MSALELPPGFALARGAFADVQLDDVVRAIAWEQRSVKMFGREIPQPRMTAWYGTEAYTYSRQRHEPRALPPIVDDIHGRLECRGTFVDRTTESFNSVLCNLYRHGSDSVAWHADDEPELGLEPTIASLSLGASRAFAIRHNTTGQRWSITLRHGDLLVMGGRSQADYQHAVPKVGAIVGARVNLTFRRIHAS